MRAMGRSDGAILVGRSCRSAAHTVRARGQRPHQHRRLRFERATQVVRPRGLGPQGTEVRQDGKPSPRRVAARCPVAKPCSCAARTSTATMRPAAARLVWNSCTPTATPAATPITTTTTASTAVLHKAVADFHRTPTLPVGYSSE